MIENRIIHDLIKASFEWKIHNRYKEYWNSFWIYRERVFLKT